MDATLKALEAFPGSLIVILGGKDKGSRLHAAARAAPATGASGASDRRGRGKNRRADLAGAVPIEHAGTLDRAVRAGDGDARSLETLCLLAPACASFDQFENYEQRGRVFKELVAQT